MVPVWRNAFRNTCFYKKISLLMVHKLTRLVLIFFAFLVSSCAHATITLQANGATRAITFSGNNVSAHIADSNDMSSSFYLGRNDPTIVAGTNDGLAQYAISQAREGLGFILPCTPTTVRLNGLEKQPNPLSGQKIAVLGLFSGAYGTKTPFAVTQDNPQNLYWNVSSSGLDPFDVFSVTNIADANGAVTSGVVAATGASIFEVTSTTQIRGNFIFAAVKPNGAIFGAAGSGVAMIGQNGSSLAQAAAIVGDGIEKSVPLDGTQSYVKIVTNANVQQATPDVYFDPITQRVYSAFTVTTAAGVGDGARGIVMGYFNPITIIPNTVLSKLVLTDFAPATAYAGLAATAVGGLVSGGGAVTGTYSKFCSMYTSTGLTYGIIVGSNGATPANQTVSAVPTVNKSVDPTNTTWPTDPIQGVMASKVVNPGVNLKTFFNSQFPLYYPYRGRGFQVPATTPADMPLFTDDAVKVGGGVAPWVINDIQVDKDTVFVAVNAGAANAAGVFASQALFDGNAAIKGWTPWQRVATPTTTGNTIYGIGYQPQVGRLFTMEGATGNTIDTILTTTWNTADNDGLLGGTTTNAQVGFVELIDTQFSEGQGGIQAAFDFPNNTLGFATVPNRLSAMIFTGYKQIVIAQTGADTGGGIFTPTVGNFSTNMQNSTNGAVTAPGAGALILSITGGALDTIGAITSAAVVRDVAVGPGNGYFVVGGVGGLAVLKPGWPMGVGLLKNFANLPSSAFTLMGSYKNVRKIWSDDTNFYVLTNETFDRIPATQLAGATLTPVTLATPALLPQQYGQFSDVVVSAKVALLATSQGLFRTGDGANASTAVNPAAMAWTAVTLPESQVAVTRLQPLSTTGLPEGFSKNPVGGTVYVLAGSVNYNLASLYRIAVASTEAVAVTATTVQVIPDYFVQGTTSAFAALGAYRNYATTFGALVTASESSPDGSSPIFEALPPILRTGVFIAQNRNVQIQAGISTAITIGNLLRNSGIGSLILPTNTGMRVLE
jgi:hypothetical protein